MPAPIPFALYRKSHPTLTEPVGAALDIELRFPAMSAGVAVFRSSLWLPLPEACRSATALSLDGSTLQAQFRPAEFALETDDARWFTRAEDTGLAETRLELVWPAPIVRIDDPFPGVALDFGLHRTDGEAISADAAQTGRTGTALNPPWVGSPVVVKFTASSLLGGRHNMTENLRALPAQSRSRATGTQAGTAVVHDKADTQLAIHEEILRIPRGSELVPRIRIGARPASPRLRLVLEGAEADGNDRLLWQAMLPGEQDAPVTLPAEPLAKEWAAALEQVLAFCQRDPVPEVLPRLRLDIESDASCLVKLSMVALSLLAEHALLTDPLRLDFDGKQHASRDLALAPTHAGSPLQLTLSGRLRAADTPPAGELPTAGGPDGRSGLLVEEDQRVGGERRLDAPATLAGFSFDWHALSERLTGVLRVLPAAARRGTPALVERAFDFDTAHPAGTASRPQRLAVRWPALDLQAQALRVELVVTHGRGLWLAEPGGQGWRVHRVPEDGEGRAVGLALQAAWLEAAPGAASGSTGGSEPVFSLGAHTLAFTTRDKDRFELSIATPTLASWPALPIKVASGVAAEVVVESATLRTVAI
ncbi:hypothetical protein [Thauera sp.]|jgi:hypothetical protein|uniref:hypothetical protein n=1 Tax=Thauera sp. TaxID=1905334 RepID=UPI002A35B208|nr:hypothetical protein [Thauera sp.]MDX9885503.1 hypothetical protein [Thauera sp.]